MTFDELTRLDAAGVWNVPDGWQQGRGAFGGLTLAVLARAAGGRVDPSERPLRAITAEIPSAVLVGPAQVKLSTLREGNALSTIVAHLERAGEVVAHAVMTFGKTRPVGFDRVELPRPSPPPFADVPVVPNVSFGPAFAHHLEYRLVSGVPFSDARDASIEGWVRFLEPGDVPRWVALIGLVDAYFPSVLPVLAGPRPFGTISFAAQLFEAEWSLREPLYHRSRLLGSQHGYLAEVRELWTPAGELCAINQQTMAIIK